jgi:hypothetical protein
VVWHGRRSCQCGAACTQVDQVGILGYDPPSQLTDGARSLVDLD